MEFSLADRTFPVFGKELPPKEYNWSDGAIFLINKPKGWTSFRVVGYLRKLLNFKKIGHAGTLDPMATGLLVLCVGKATKAVERIQAGFKVYEAGICLGASTPTYDAESEADATAAYKHITLEELHNKVTAHFLGEILQKAPAYSALKHQGKPLYKLARAGKEVPVKERWVHIYEHQILCLEGPQVYSRIKCSKGTYIRSIAHDLGKACDSLAHLNALVRSEVSPFHLDDAIEPELLKEKWLNGTVNTF